MNRHIGICSGPCQNDITTEEYLKRVEDAKRFLRGEWRAVKNDLQKRMIIASREKKFEEAARLRDVLHAMERFLSRRTLLGSAPDDEDVVAIEEQNGQPVFFERALTVA